ncbi:GIY-YIG nuclease family protein [Pontivivens nitratireducens]|uniref:GIY-YIG nuclease family protein n=1 Tax=Pontivivens nitratireducens TaxID=2758038 RepID=A0A6G7VHE1_9RHOB|nr:GIY-YIG nuclease family protein [Pontibrevibacter nitratireducens]QIK39296.1 GIY-YIG nuclease family protein [Pontibrevibacter nitratireducens]
MEYTVYILANRSNRAIYVGLTRDLSRRIEQHKSGRGSRHTARYGITRLVWHMQFDDLHEARLHERRLKRWRRAWKDDLISRANPRWVDLAETTPV